MFIYIYIRTGHLKNCASLLLLPQQTPLTDRPPCRQTNTQTDIYEVDLCCRSIQCLLKISRLYRLPVCYHAFLYLLPACYHDILLASPTTAQLQWLISSFTTTCHCSDTNSVGIVCFKWHQHDFSYSEISYQPFNSLVTLDWEVNCPHIGATFLHP